jgi:predicted lipase
MATIMFKARETLDHLMYGNEITCGSKFSKNMQLVLTDFSEQHHGAIQNMLLAPALIMISYKPKYLHMWTSYGIRTKCAYKICMKHTVTCLKVQIC